MCANDITTDHTKVEAVNHFRLQPTSMSYVCKVYDHLLHLWMGGMLCRM